MPDPLAVEIALSEDEREVVCPSCPTGALSATGLASKSLALSFGPSACPACGACASACPEGAVSLRRVIASSSLSAGRQAVTEVVGEERCLSCGRPLAGGLVARAVADQLGASHPQIAGRLRKEDRRTVCLLAVGHAYGRPPGARP